VSAEGDENETAEGNDVDLGRVLALSDGVFAIAMTLLVLDIRVPDEAHGAEFQKALVELVPAVSGYLISYLVIGVLWLTHHRLFRRLRLRHPRIVTLNVVLLGFVALLPFPSSLLAKHGNESISFILYAANVIAVFAMQIVITAVAQAAGDADPMPGRFPRLSWYTLPIGACLVFLVWVLVAEFVSPSQANWAWLLLVPVSMISQRLRNSKAVLPQS
jgi:uncharacterized membrane protein